MMLDQVSEGGNAQEPFIQRMQEAAGRQEGWGAAPFGLAHSCLPAFLRENPRGVGAHIAAAKEVRAGESFI